MHQGDTVQIEAPKFDPDINGNRPLNTIKKPDEASIPGTLPTIPEVMESDDENRYTPAANTAQTICQETNWPDAIPMQIPRVSSLTAQPEEQGHNRHQAQHYTEDYEIPKLEETLRRNNLLILIHLWHIIIYIEPVNESDKNTIPIYKIWTMTDIMPRLTRWTVIRAHWLHRTIGRQISKNPTKIYGRA